MPWLISLQHCRCPSNWRRSEAYIRISWQKVSLLQRLLTSKTEMGSSTVHDGIHGDRGPAANLATIRAALGVSPVDDAAHFESIYRDLEQARVYYHTFPRDCSQRTAANLADDLLAFIESYWQAELRAPGPPPTMRRPLHFACHGTGGLIVKLAIVRAAESKDPGISVIAKSCFSIAFFGVPRKS